MRSSATNSENSGIISSSAAHDSIHYLALGDSYTIGEAVPEELSFPYQLATLLNKNDSPKIAKPVIIARTGWTTDELIQAIAQSGINKKFDFVTLLIGVNNQYRGYDINVYRREFVQLLQIAINYADGKTSRAFVVSIPDYSVTPFASGSNTAKIATEIDEYNAINKEECEKAGVNYTDITGISRQATNQSDLIASDGLHPSDVMYAAWVDQLAPRVLEKIK
jgi:lysophospholipase L1-like esterase